MNYKANKNLWRKGDIVIHDADAKEPKMLMKVIGYTRHGLCKTQYVDRNKKRTIYQNEIKYLHQPERFNILSCWADYLEEAFQNVQHAWERVRIWNKVREIGTRVKTTSADGGFEAITGGHAYIDAAGQAMIYLVGYGNWCLDYVEVIRD